MLIQWEKGRKLYEGYLADDAHASITELKDFKGRYNRFTLGLLLNKKPIGTGDLMRWRGATRGDYLQTESTALRRIFRKKGHGIVLYMFLVETARILGAKRIYSSRSLNKHSRRMWEVKLAEIYNVKKIPGFCRYCHHKFAHGKKPVFFIDLQEK